MRIQITAEEKSSLEQFDGEDKNFSVTEIYIVNTGSSFHFLFFLFACTNSSRKQV